MGMPWAFKPLWKRKFAHSMRIYAIIMAVDPRLMNQPKTTADAVLQVMNAREAT